MGAIEGYGRKEGMVDAPGMFFSSLEFLYIIPGHQKSHTFYKKYW